MPANVDSCLALIRGHVEKLFNELEPTCSTPVLGGRDPAKERRIRAQISGIMMGIYASTLELRDVGIPAVILECNALIQENWTERLAPAYWEAKGL